MDKKSEVEKVWCNLHQRFHKVTNTSCVNISQLIKSGGDKPGEETVKPPKVSGKRKPRALKEPKIPKHYRHRVTSEHLKELIKKTKPKKWNWCVICGKTDPKSGMSKETDEPYCVDCYELVKKARGEGKRIFKELGTDIDVDDYPVTDIEPEEELVEEQDKPKRKRKSSKRKK